MKLIAFTIALVAAVKAGDVSEDPQYCVGEYCFLTEEEAYAHANSSAAAYEGSAAESSYDGDVWASKAQAVDTDESWGKKYDSVDAKSFND